MMIIHFFVNMSKMIIIKYSFPGHGKWEFETRFESVHIFQIIFINVTNWGPISVKVVTDWGI